MDHDRLPASLGEVIRLSIQGLEDERRGRPADPWHEPEFLRRADSCRGGQPENREQERDPHVPNDHPIHAVSSRAVIR